MAKVLSTKLTLDEIDRFTAMAEQEGESKSGLVRRLVLDYLNSGSKTDSATSAGPVNPAKASKKGLLPEKTKNENSLPLSQSPSVKPSLSDVIRSKGLASVCRQRQANSPAPTSAGNIRLANDENVGHHSQPLPSPKDSLPVYHVDSKGSPEANTKSSTGRGWLLLLILLALWLKSQPSITVDRKSTFTTHPPQADENGLYTFRVGDTVVYSSSPIPFW